MRSPFSTLRALFCDARYSAARFIVLAFLLWRGALFAVDFAAIHSLPERSPNPNKDYVAFAQSRFWNTFARWDSGWYDRISRRGYYYEGGQSNVAFFPAYPYLARWLGRLTGSHFSAGLLLSNLSLLVALFFVYGIARRYLEDDGARRAVLFVLAFPSAFFFSAFYAESLFLMTVAGALFFYEKDRLLPAALFGMGAALTRSSGVILFPALLLGAMHRRGWRPRAFSPRLLFLLLIPAGLGVLMIVQWHQVGDPLAWLKAQAGWGRSSTFPLWTLFQEARNVRLENGLDVLDVASAAGLFVAVGVALRRLDLAHTIFLLGSVLMPLASGRALSMTRFAACVVPLFVVLALVSSRRGVERFLFFAMTLLLAWQAILFANWYWSG